MIQDLSHSCYGIVRVLVFTSGSLYGVTRQIHTGNVLPRCLCSNVTLLTHFCIQSIHFNSNVRCRSMGLEPATFRATFTHSATGTFCQCHPLPQRPLQFLSKPLNPSQFLWWVVFYLSSNSINASLISYSVWLSFHQQTICVNQRTISTTLTSHASRSEIWRQARSFLRSPNRHTAVWFTDFKAQSCIAIPFAHTYFSHCRIQNLMRKTRKTEMLTWALGVSSVTSLLQRSLSCAQLEPRKSHDQGSPHYVLCFVNKQQRPNFRHGGLTLRLLNKGLVLCHLIQSLWN